MKFHRQDRSADVFAAPHGGNEPGTNRRSECVAIETHPRSTVKPSRIMKTMLVNVLAIVPAVLLLAPGRLPAQSAYFQAITNLNPAGYWPMHEVEAAAPGDIETNYGTLGPLGEGFYPDWAVPPNVNKTIQRGVPGALANDGDTAVNFTRSGSPPAATYTNVLFVAHNSPLATLNPPFSVECWFFPTNTASEDIWAQNGYEGLNAGGTGGGAGGVGGIRLVWENGTNTGFQIYTYDNSSALISPGFSGNVGGTPVSPMNQWYHLVVTCDANTNFSLYVNGAQPSLSLVTGNGPGSYTPDYWSPLTVGGGRGGTRAVGGYIDEFAVYTNVINDIYTHYEDGISGGAGAYFHDVTNDDPVIYLRMDAPASYTPPAANTWPVLANYGVTNGVPVGNGVYTPGTVPGLITAPPLNPNGVPYAGLPSRFAALSGVSSFADAGYAAAYNPVGPTPFSVTALFRGDPSDGRNNTIVGHSDNSWNLMLNTTGHLFWRFGTNTTANLTSVGNYNDGNWHQVTVVYTPNSNPSLPGTNALYVDGSLDTATNNATVNGFLPGSSADVLIGSDPQYTNNPAGVGRSFAGQISDVAIFDQALTAAQIQGLYNACGIAPYITGQPVTGRVVNGGSGSYVYFVALAGGSSPFAYHWYFNTVSNYSGATLLADDGVHYFNTATLNMTVTNLTGNDSGYYFAVVTNNYGAITTRLADLTINTAVTIIAQYPVPYTNQFTLFAGSSPTFSVTASGTPPFSYQWFTNGVLDGAATASNFTWADVSSGSISNYCIVANSGSSATSFVWAASVIPAPVAPYPTNVLALNPIGYWRLDEGPDDGNGNAGVLCHDYVGGNDGIYTNVYLGNASYSATDPETSAQFGQFGSAFFDGFYLINNYAGGIQGVDFAAPAGSNAEFTVEAWVNGYASQQIIGGAIATKGYYNSNDQFNLGVDSTHVHFRFYVRDATGGVHIVGSGTSPAMDGNWHHLAGVCDEANGQLLLYYDGQLAGTASIPTNAGVYEVSLPMSIGAGTTDGINYTNQFSGFINDVAVFNRALSAGQIAGQYVSVNVSPSFIQPPPPAIATNGGASLNIPVIALGTPPLNYTWSDYGAGTNIITGSTNGDVLDASLAIGSLPAAWNNDQLELTVSDNYGTTNVFVTLALATNAPQITQDLPPQTSVVTGNSYTYSIGVTGMLPLSYQWYNGAGPISGQTGTSYSVTAGSPGNATYFVVITNVFGATTSTVSAFAGIPQLTNAYAASVLALKPVGYWPLQETNPAAPVSMETNYGTLGELGNAYYSATNGSVVNFGQPGGLASDADTAAAFGIGQISYAFVPRFSPAMTIKAPFTVEAWVNPSNTTYGVIVGEGGGEGLNGNAHYGGFQLGFGNVSGSNEPQMLYYTGGNNTYTQFNTPSNCPAGSWYHLVATYDGTNSISYLDGYPMITGTVAQVPDLEAPLTIGNGKWTTTGGQRQIQAVIDEVAIYTNVLSPGRIADHYNAGVDPTDYGAYMTNILADQPLLYYRMDCAGFTNAPVNICPEAVNYGSAPVDGVYLPGVVPGGVAGPVSNNVAAPINGVISCVDAGNDPSFDPTGANAFTAMCWFKGNPSDGRLQTIMSHGATNWSLNVDGSSGLAVLSTLNGSLTSSSIINDGGWHFLAGVDDGTNVYLYVDGRLDATAPLPGTNGLAAEPNVDLYLGGNADDTQVGKNEQYFSGAIAQAALFTNALSAAQIQQIYSVAVPYTVNTNPTNLLFSIAGGNLTLSWPADHIGWQLQAQTNSLAAGIGRNWVNVSGTLSTNQFVIPINLTNGCVFYRLIY